MNREELNLYQSTVQEFTTRLELITEVVKIIYANQLAHQALVAKEFELLRLRLEQKETP